MYKLNIKMLKNEYWYGGDTNRGYTMPVNNNSLHFNNNTVVRSYGQSNTLFLSSKGRIIYSENGFLASFVLGKIICKSKKSEIKLLSSNEKTLKGAYKFAVNNFMKPDGNMPNKLMFSTPQYCTWIELDNNQNESGILNYAKSIVDCNMKPGELIIDDGWQKNFGDWQFDRKKFTNPKKMIDILHSMGFKIILWICPFISEKAADFEYLKSNGILVRDKYGKPVSRKWWNGSDYLLDLSNEKALEWFEIQTEKLTRELDIDGFKQDAGDAMYYKDDDITKGQIDANTQSELWAKSSLKYDFNELRACFKCGCMGVAQRLADKSHKWNYMGLGALLPNALTQGISGYAFSCPDMIGGGQIEDFRKVPQEKLDHELFARYCEASALMPMMQYSLGIWKLGNNTTKEICKKMSELHINHSDYIIKLAENSAKSGEPIVRYMEYQYPNCGYESIKDQFMLGDNIIVAPILKKGQTSRKVVIPDGKWQYKDKIYSTKTADIKCNIDELIYLKRIKAEA